VFSIFDKAPTNILLASFERRFVEWLLLCVEEKQLGMVPVRFSEVRGSVSDHTHGSKNESVRQRARKKREIWRQLHGRPIMGRFLDQRDLHRLTEFRSTNYRKHFDTDSVTACRGPRYLFPGKLKSGCWPEYSAIFSS
jgi:hypothetical protein